MTIFNVFLFYLKDDLYRRTVVFQKWFPPQYAILVLLGGMFLKGGMTFWILTEWTSILTNNVNLVSEISLLIFYSIALSPSLLNIGKFFERYHYDFFKISMPNKNYLRCIVFINYALRLFYSLPTLFFLILIGIRHLNILIYILGIVLGYLIYLIRIVTQKAKYIQWFLLVFEYIVAYFLALFGSLFLYKLLFFFQRIYLRYGFSNKLNIIVNDSLENFVKEKIKYVNRFNLIGVLHDHIVLVSVIVLIIIMIIVYFTINISFPINIYTKNILPIITPLNFESILILSNLTTFFQDLDVQKYPNLIKYVPIEFFLVLGFITSIIPKLSSIGSVTLVGTVLVMMLIVNFYKNLIALSTNVFDYIEDYSLLPIIKMNSHESINTLTKAKARLLITFGKRYLLINLIIVFVIINIISKGKGLFLILPIIFFWRLRSKIIIGSLKSNNEIFNMLSKEQRHVKFETLRDVTGGALIKQKNRMLTSVINNLICLSIIIGFSFKIFNSLTWGLMSIIIMLITMVNFWINSRYLN